MSRTGRFVKKEPVVLEKLIKLVEKWTELPIILQKETEVLVKLVR